MILNPRSLRCVQATGRVARNLLRRGNIGNVDVGYGMYAAPPRRRTVRAPRRIGIPSEGGSLAGAFGATPSRHSIPALGALFAPPAEPTPKPVSSRHRVAAVPELTGSQPCPPGTVRNPKSQRCIKITGRTYKRLQQPVTGPTSLPVFEPVSPPPMSRIPTRRPTPYARTYSERSPELPVGSAAPAPIGDRPAILEWADINCENTRDPITGTRIESASLDSLLGLVRTHDGQCTFAPGLHQHVYAAHRTGQIATLPADASTHMTLDDFKALRATMRRRDPGYKIPGRRHQPPPPTWQLYIASDQRSGPDYASVMYVDTSKGRYTAYGIEYPPESVRVDLGFIPVSVPSGSICSPKTLSELISQLAELNKLLVPVAGGWKPVGGFPYRKSHWEHDRAARVGRLCQDLAKVLASPI